MAFNVQTGGGGSKVDETLGTYITTELLQTLISPSPNSSNFLGFGVAINSTYVFVGEANGDVYDTNYGAVYQYDYNGTLINTYYPTNQVSSYYSYVGTIKVTETHMIVGAYSDDTTGSDQGRAYVYEIGTTTPLYTLENPNSWSATTTSDNFGYSVAISDNYFAVGAPSEEDSSGNTDQGVVYVYDIATGTLQHTLQNPNYYSSTFGEQMSAFSLNMTDDYIITGAYVEDNATNTGVGVGYIFSTTTGSLLYTIENPFIETSTAHDNDNFGRVCSINGNIVALGSRNIDVGSNVDEGRIYLYDITQFPTAPAVLTGTTNVLYTIENPNTATTEFGAWVDIYENYVAIASHKENDLGVVYIYDLNSTTPTIPYYTFDNPNYDTTSSLDYFGYYAVALYGNKLVVGASQEDVGSVSNTGIAYLFQFSSEEVVSQITYNENTYTDMNYGSVADSNFVASNIAYGVEVFGITGTSPSAGIKSIQRGTATFDTSSAYTKLITISSVDTNKTIVRISYKDPANSSYNKLYISGRLTSSTQLTLSKYAGFTAMTVEYEVIEFDGVVVQSGYHTWLSYDDSITINEVDISKSLVFWDTEIDEASLTNVSIGLDSVYLSNSTTLKFEGSTLWDVNDEPRRSSWFVVTFN